MSLEDAEARLRAICEPFGTIVIESSSPSGAVRVDSPAAQRLIAILRRFGWLVHPTKCTGTSEAVQAFRALGMWVDLATQTFAVPPDMVSRILDAATTLFAQYGFQRTGMADIARAAGLSRQSL